MTAAPIRQACPVCDFELTPGAGECPNCRTDLRLFSVPPDIAQDFYNEGLDRAHAGDREGALAKMRGALAADPYMVDGYIVAGKLLAQSGKAADMEQAIAYWNKALGLSTTEEQARSLARCIAQAKASLRQLEREARSRRANALGGLISGGLVFAAACGVAGYFLRPARIIRVESNTGSKSAGNSNSGTVGIAGRKTVPYNPVDAINTALNRPDIVVVNTGHKLALVGKVSSESEKKIALAAAAYAARMRENQIDSDQLKVQPPFRAVGSQRVERMLHLFVKGLGRNHSDPLYDANLAVTGGKDAEPLKVTGTCLSPKAGAEIAQLVKEVYPSANKVDASGLKVMTATTAEEPVQVAVRTGPKWKKSRRLKSSGDQIYVNLSKKTYTVQPGDSIFVIARKYGHRGADWYALWEANRKTIKNPHALTVGTVLKLPPGWHMSNKTEDSNP